MTFEELQIQLEEDLTFTEDNISQKILAVGRTYHKYLKLLSSERMSQAQLEQQRIEMYGKQYHELIKKGYDGFDVGKQKNSIETYILMNDKYRTLVGKIAKNQVYIDHLEKSLDMISKNSFNIKNYLDNQKLKLGLGI